MLFFFSSFLFGLFCFCFFFFLCVCFFLFLMKITVFPSIPVFFGLLKSESLYRIYISGSCLLFLLSLFFCFMMFFCFCFCCSACCLVLF